MLFEKYLKKQKKLIAILVVIFGLLLGAVYWWGFSGNNKVEGSIDIKIAMPGKDIDKRDLWISKVEAESKLQERKIGILERFIEKTAKEKVESEGEVEELKKEVKELRSRLETYEKNGIRGDKNLSSKSLNASSSSSFSDHFSDEEKYEAIKVKREPILKYEVRLTMQKGVNNRNIDNFIPAGSFAKSLLLGSIDANCGVGSTADPKPMTLRMLDNGILPNKFKSKVKRCFVVASGYGDISSERVYIRLERMSCIEKDGSIIETDVAGYVVGEDGKAGLRGVVVDKSGKMLARSAMGGFLSGMSQFLQNSISNKSMLTSVGNKDQSLSVMNFDALKSGGTAGATSALDKLSEYWIKRAEQLQPVIQVDAGRVVNIVFTHGFAFGAKDTKKKIRLIQLNQNTNPRDSNSTENDTDLFASAHETKNEEVSDGL